MTTPRAARWGGLPSVARSSDPRSDLLDYVGLYLQEEVRAEGLVRSDVAFARFLEVAAGTNGEQVSFAGVSRDAEVPARTGRFEVEPGRPDYGRALEHLVFCELRAAISYRRLDVRLAYWRSQSQLEVDFVVERRGTPLLAIAVKAAGSVSGRDLRGLRAFAEDWPGLRRIVVSTEPHRRTTEEGIEILPIDVFLADLWSGALLS